MLKSTITVTIIIATHGRPGPLGETLQSLCQVHVPNGWLVELLVVENGSKDAIEDLLRSICPPRIAVRYLYEPAKGKSRALNLALSEAKGEILMFTDDDVRFPVDWLVQMCRPILDGKGCAVAGGATLAPGLARPWLNRYLGSWLGCTNYDSSNLPVEMAGINMAYHRQVLTHVPQFDIELGGGGLGNAEDALFSRQVRAAGFALICGWQSQVEHHFHPDRLQYAHWLKTAQNCGRSSAYLGYHWLHENPRWPRLMYCYFWLKLNVRRALSPNLLPTDEGIPAWEFSYVFDLAQCAQFLIELKRPRNYSKRGLVKLNGIM